MGVARSVAHQSVAAVDARGAATPDGLELDIRVHLGRAGRRIPLGELCHRTAHSPLAGVVSGPHLQPRGRVKAVTRSATGLSKARQNAVRRPRGASSGGLKMPTLR